MSQLLDSVLPPLTFEAIEGLQVIEPTGPMQELVMSTDWHCLYSDMDEMAEASPRIAEMFKVTA